MNYYKRHLGDYAKDAGHLTLLEHGAYTILLDRLYGSEKPVPEADVYRVTRAATKPERDAVDAVLREFFVCGEHGWMQSRVMEEIEKAGEAADKNRNNGAKGGRPKKDPKPEKNPCPHKEIISAYHEILRELPPVHEWSDANAENLRARWRSKTERQDVKWWREYFEYVKKSDFLMGVRGDFQASLGWLVNASNFAKVVNGNYENRSRP
jgi:uncharacterized protein YdaU (DUF1376 family)